MNNLTNKKQSSVISNRRVIAKDVSNGITVSLIDFDRILAVDVEGHDILKVRLNKGPMSGNPEMQAVCLLDAVKKGRLRGYYV